MMIGVLPLRLVSASEASTLSLGTATFGKWPLSAAKHIPRFSQCEDGPSSRSPRSVVIIWLNAW